MAVKKSLQTGSPGSVKLNKAAMARLVTHCEEPPKANSALLSFVSAGSRVLKIGRQ